MVAPSVEGIRRKAAVAAVLEDSRCGVWVAGAYSLRLLDGHLRTCAHHGPAASGDSDVVREVCSVAGEAVAGRR